MLIRIGIMKERLVWDEEIGAGESRMRSGSLGLLVRKEELYGSHVKRVGPCGEFIDAGCFRKIVSWMGILCMVC